MEIARGTSCDPARPSLTLPLETPIDPYLAYIIEARENGDRFTVVLVLDVNTVSASMLTFLHPHYQAYWKTKLSDHLDITADRILRVQAADDWFHVKPTTGEIGVPGMKGHSDKGI